MKLKPMFREMRAENVAVDVEKRTMEFSFSSEFPVDRYFGREILSHDPKAVDLARLNGGASLLWNHNSNEVRGKVEKGWIEGKRGFVKVRFSKSAKAVELLEEVRDEIVQNVSFGYRVHEMTLTKTGDDGDEYTATRWEPFEVSFVSIPADPTVGPGRAGNDEEHEVRVIKPATSGGEREMETEAEKQARLAREATERQALRDQTRKEELDRISAIRALGDKFGKPDLARQLTEGGKSIEEARAAFLDSMGVTQKPVSERDGELGLTPKEVKQYSVMRALRALAFPTERQYQEDAAFEREVSAAAVKLTGKPIGGKGNGYRIPFDVLAAPMAGGRRDLSVGTSTAGGHTVATNLESGSFIDMLRNSMALNAVGVRILNGLVGNIAIPRQTGGATAYYVAESGAVTESQQAVDQVTMNPKTIGAFTDFSRKLILQSSLDVENFVKGDIAQVIALAIDSAGLYGSGASNQPTGVKNVSGINTKDLAAAAATYAEIVELETLVAADNAAVGSLAYLLNATSRGSAKTTEKFSSTGQTLWEPGNTMNGYKAVCSNQIASGDYFFGNWADLILGFWSGLDLLVDPYTGGLSGTVRVIMHQDFDVAVRHAESFCRANNTL